ncbi:MAG: hypothetical protein ACTS6G_05420 [Candidatus Hodgkinia cicadicola]
MRNVTLAPKLIVMKKISSTLLQYFASMPRRTLTNLKLILNECVMHTKRSYWAWTKFAKVKFYYLRRREVQLVKLIRLSFRRSFVPKLLMN